MLIHLRNILSRACYSTTRARQAVVPFYLSDIGEGIAEVQINQWHVQPGAKVNEYEPICDAKSDKATVTITSRFNGVISSISHKENDFVKVGDVLVYIDTEDEVQTKSNVEKKAEEPAKPKVETDKKLDYSGIVAAPSAKVLARANNIDLKNVAGTGPSNLITKQDVLKYLEGEKTPEKTPQKAEPLQSEFVKLPPVGRGMFKTMTESAKIPHLTIHDETNVAVLNSFVKSLPKPKNDGSMKFTMLPFIIKALSLSLNKFPLINSKIIDENTISLLKSHNVSVAIDTEHGLLVPNVKDVQLKSVSEITQEINRLRVLAQQNKLTTKDLTEGTITVSNIGSVGVGKFYNPCILPPQLAIVAVGKSFTPNSTDVILPTSWAADHRVIDGATFARFIKLFTENLSDLRNFL